MRILIEICVSVLRRTDSSGWWGRQEQESTESRLHTCGSWRNEERRSQGVSAVSGETGSEQSGEGLGGGPSRGHP